MPDYPQSFDAVTVAPGAGITRDTGKDEAAASAAPGATVYKRTGKTLGAASATSVVGFLYGPAFSSQLGVGSVSFPRAVSHKIPAATPAPVTTYSKRIYRPIAAATATMAVTIAKRTSMRLSAATAACAGAIGRGFRKTLAGILNLTPLFDIILLHPEPLRLLRLASVRKLATIRVWSWRGGISMMQFTQAPDEQLLYRQEIEDEPVVSATWTLTRTDTGATAGTVSAPSNQGYQSDVVVSGLTDGVDYLLSALVQTSRQRVKGKALISCRS